MSPHCCLLPLRVQETPRRGLERQAGAGHCSETMLLAWVIDREICQLAAGPPPHCPHSPRSGTVPLAGTCWRAWRSPALLRDPLTWIHGQLLLQAAGTTEGTTGLPLSQQAAATYISVLIQQHPRAGNAPNGRSPMQGPTDLSALQVLHCLPWESTHGHSSTQLLCSS